MGGMVLQIQRVRGKRVSGELTECVRRNTAGTRRMCPEEHAIRGRLFLLDEG